MLSQNVICGVKFGRFWPLTERNYIKTGVGDQRMIFFQKKVMVVSDDHKNKFRGLDHNVIPKHPPPYKYIDRSSFSFLSQKVFKSAMG